jgi:hypothetical protein
MGYSEGYNNTGHIFYCRNVRLQADILHAYRNEDVAQVLSSAINNTMNGDRAIYIITSLRAGQPRNRGSISSKGKHYLSSLMSPGWLWVHPTSYSNGNAFSFPRGKVDAARLTTQIHTMARLKISKSIPPHPNTLS